MVQGRGCMKLSVLIPVYNEAKTIGGIVERVKATGLADEIIIVDDGSIDGTREVLRGFVGEGVTVIAKEHNAGKGSALREGLKLVTGDVVIIQDADLEYDPKDYPALIGPIVSGRADIVYGSRWLNAGLQGISPNLFKAGRWFLTFLTNLLYGIKLTDEPCGYKVFRTEVIKSIPLKCKRFEFCPEITAKASRRGYAIHEVPIHYYPRTVEEGKKIRYRDGVEAVLTLLRYRFWK
jgi:dolichol-phosphate mannosyltransferase